MATEPERDSRGSTDASGAAKRSEGESGHHYGIDDGEAHDPLPLRGVIPPLSPGRKHGVGRKNCEKGSGGFVEELPRDAPEGAQGDSRGTNEGREQVRGHGTILEVIQQMASPAIFVKQFQ